MPREMAGACSHHFALQSRHRAGFVLCPQASSTREIRAWITTSPDTQLSTSLEVVSTCVRRPLAMSVFCEIAVCVLEWKGSDKAGLMSGVGRGVFMEMDCPLFCPDQRDMTVQMICLEMP